MSAVSFLLPTFRAHAYLFHSGAVQQASRDGFSSFSLNVLAPAPLMFSSTLLLLSILVISMSNCWPSNTQASQFLNTHFFLNFACDAFWATYFHGHSFQPKLPATAASLSSPLRSHSLITCYRESSPLRPNFSDPTPLSWPSWHTSCPSFLPYLWLHGQSFATFLHSSSALFPYCSHT